VPIIAQYLFGSYARQDQNTGSDIDILCVTHEDWQKPSSYNKVNVNFYPKNDIIDSSKRGDLFILHIIKEAKIIYDPEKLMSILSDNFKFRASYKTDVTKASDLGAFLLNILPQISIDPRTIGIINKRFAWCARTIVIAYNVERGKILFDTRSLSESVEPINLALLLAHKDTKNLHSEDLQILTEIIARYGTAEALRRGGTIISDWEKHFVKTKNDIALKTLYEIVPLAKKQIGNTDMYY